VRLIWRDSAEGSRYVRWYRTPDGWAANVLKNARALSKLRGVVALNISVVRLVEKARAWDGFCQCCGRVELSLPYDRSALPTAHVDHDHSTGEFRGFLCASCNTRIGLIEDRELAAVCLSYLERLIRAH
jgi:hypothetical protein